MKSTRILDKDLPLNIPCPGLPASICLKGGWWWHIYEECWGRTWKRYMIAEMKLSSSLSSKCSTDVGMGNHLEKEKKKNVYISESKDACDDSLDFCPEMLAFSSGGGSSVSNSVPAAFRVLSSSPFSTPSPDVFLFVSPTLLLVSFCLSLPL